MKAERKEELPDKGKTVSSTQEKWVPIVITLESKEEAQYLWNLLNESFNEFKKFFSPFDDGVRLPDEDVSVGMWEALDKFREYLK